MYNKFTPNPALQAMASKNAKLKEVLDLVEKVGDPKTAFYQMASAKGVDPEVILSMLRK